MLPPALPLKNMAEIVIVIVTGTEVEVVAVVAVIHPIVRILAHVPAVGVAVAAEIRKNS